MINRNKQYGFSLLLVLILMLVIALIVIVTVQTSSTESRMSANEADRKLALSYAEGGLRDAENHILSLLNQNSVLFSSNCANGLCAPADKTFDSAKVSAPFSFNTGSGSSVPAWERCATAPTSACAGGSNQSVLDTGNNRFTTNDGSNTAYIIEYLGQRTDSSGSSNDYFRITSRARGNNENTLVTLQTDVVLER